MDPQFSISYLQDNVSGPIVWDNVLMGGYSVETRLSVSPTLINTSPVNTTPLNPTITLDNRPELPLHNCPAEANTDIGDVTLAVPSLRNVYAVVAYAMLVVPSSRCIWVWSANADDGQAGSVRPLRTGPTTVPDEFRRMRILNKPISKGFRGNWQWRCWRDGAPL